MTEIPDHIVKKAAQALSCLNDENWQEEQPDILNGYKQEAKDALEAAYYGELVGALGEIIKQYPSAAGNAPSVFNTTHDGYGAIGKTVKLLAKINGDVK